MREINCIAELISVLSSMNTNSENRFYYRGESQNYGLTSGLPGISRNGRLKHEFSYFRECERRLPREFSECGTTFERLVKMQHYRMPTRLLDLSLDPLIGLFFALYQDPRDIENHDDKDGVFLVYEVPKNIIKNYKSDSVSVVANIAIYSHDDLDITCLDADEDNDRAGFNKSESIQYLLHAVKAEKPHFKNWIKKQDLESVFCVHPLLNNDRIKAQQGAFLLFGIDGNRNNLAVIDRSGINLIKVRIPANSKQRLRFELALLSRSVDTIYPDWDGVTDYLLKYWKH